MVLKIERIKGYENRNAPSPEIASKSVPYAPNILIFYAFCLISKGSNFFYLFKTKKNSDCH
jgi:hypothetical protein